MEFGMVSVCHGGNLRTLVMREAMGCSEASDEYWDARRAVASVVAKYKLRCVNSSGRLWRSTFSWPQGSCGKLMTQRGKAGLGFKLKLCSAKKEKY